MARFSLKAVLLHKEIFTRRCRFPTLSTWKKPSRTWNCSWKI